MVLKVLLCSAGNSLGGALPNSPGCRCFQQALVLREICWVCEEGVG